VTRQALLTTGGRRDWRTRRAAVDQRHSCCASRRCGCWTRSRAHRASGCTGARSPGGLRYRAVPGSAGARWRAAGRSAPIPPTGGRTPHQPRQAGRAEDVLMRDVADICLAANGRLWCSHREKNAIGPSTTWLIRQSGPPRHSVGNTVTSFSSPSYPLVASKIARRKRRGVSAVDGEPAACPRDEDLRHVPLEPGPLLRSDLPWGDHRPPLLAGPEDVTRRLRRLPMPFVLRPWTGRGGTAGPPASFSLSIVLSAAGRVPTSYPAAGACSGRGCRRRARRMISRQPARRASLATSRSTSSPPSPSASPSARPR
jgi:hypothetical protein